jgi:hypothetical protein
MARPKVELIEDIAASKPAEEETPKKAGKAL